MAIMFRSYKIKNSTEKCNQNPGKSCFAVRKEWVNSVKLTHQFPEIVDRRGGSSLGPGGVKDILPKKRRVNPLIPGMQNVVNPSVPGRAGHLRYF